ncbi:MAG: hypothetical protein ACLRZ5_08195 [Ruminococcus sp.]
MENIKLAGKKGKRKKEEEEEEGREAHVKEYDGRFSHILGLVRYECGLDQSYLIKPKYSKNESST